jgi:hypothetical protein
LLVTKIVIVGLFSTIVFLATSRIAAKCSFTKWALGPVPVTLPGVHVASPPNCESFGVTGDEQDLVLAQSIETAINADARLTDRQI